MTASPWRLAAAELALALAVIGGSVSFAGVLRGYGWLYPVAMVTCATLAAAGVARALRWHPVPVALAGLAGWTASMCFLFFRDQSIAGFVPGPPALVAAREAAVQAWDTVLYETVPASPNVGTVALLTGAIALLALVAETIALSCRLPALSGIALLALLTVPAMLKPESIGAAGFAAAAGGYLCLLAAAPPEGAVRVPERHRDGPRAAPTRLAAAASPARIAALAAGIVAAALVLAQAVPGFDRGLFPEGSRLGALGQNVGLNPLISLGSDLRSATGVSVLRYATDSDRPLYLRTVTVDRFDGGTWAPTNRDGQRQYPLDGISPRLSLAAAPGTRAATTAVTTGGFTSPYLPAPYAPVSVTGERGRFGWDPADLSIKGEPAASRDQSYVVRSVMPVITRRSLAAAQDAPRGISSAVQEVPRGVPDLVRDTAATVTQDAETPYARALALQSYLRGFAYSEETPAEDGYDGTGMDVLETFLEKRTGYCIHFSAAMAVMSRTLGIPSRIAVGFAPGTATGRTVAVPGAGELPEFAVDGGDAHAWPELYFEGLGWVPFEPTPSRGVVPDYATSEDAGAGASTNRDVPGDALSPESAAPVPTATPTPTPPAGDGTPDARPTSGASPVLAVLAALAILLAVALPATVRAVQRRRRLARGLGGIWEELEAIGTDHGLAPRPSDTPRTYTARLAVWDGRDGADGPDPPGPAPGDDGSVRAALATLTREYERHGFGRPGYTADEDAARRAVELIHRAGKASQAPLSRARIAAVPPSSVAWLARPFTRLAPAAAAAGTRARALWARVTRRG
ncbi:DUF3488 and transglutaminase-like domain-containing protein [Sinomonas halotolerans]|uniref:DUF3488 and transglutaminase-like domain-containing protein n=1 Tax=Sinomonas halotolerans TaxID=1644133 RepID=A0ABU9WXR1_9MICC